RARRRRSATRSVTASAASLVLLKGVTASAHGIAQFQHVGKILGQLTGPREPARRRAHHFACIRITYCLYRLAGRVPHALRYAFGELRLRIAGHGLDQEKVTELVNETAAVTKKPVDGRQLRHDRQLQEAGLLRNFT